MAGYDMAEVTLDFLRNGTDAASVRALVLDGEANILEAGDLTEEILLSAIEKRRNAEDKDVVLALSVQDAGERETGPNLYEQFVVIRIYDRNAGYKNIRKVKLALMKVIRYQFADFDDEANMGLLEAMFNDRTGHRYDRQYNIEYEAITFRCAVMRGD